MPLFLIDKILKTMHIAIVGKWLNKLWYLLMVQFFTAEKVIAEAPDACS